MEESVIILEQTMIKGVTVIRGDNPPLELIYSDFKYESQGLLDYQLKQEYCNAHTRSTLHNIVLRLYVEISTPWVVRKRSSQDSKTKNVSSVDGKYRHLVVFENQLRAPKSGALWKEMDENYLKQYRVDNDKWYITDVDGWFKGNKLLYQDNQISSLYTV